MESINQTPELWYHQLGTQYVLAQIFFHFNQAGVIKFLDENGPTTSHQMSQHLNLDHAMLDSLLNYASQVDPVIGLNLQGEFMITEFGQQVLMRYTRQEKNLKMYNFHEVRVGAYGPVWSEIGGLLRNRKRYGDDVKRNGEFAEDGVYAQAQKFKKSILESLHRCGAQTTIEFGANTGITEQVALGAKGINIYCVDRSEHSLGKAKARFQERTDGGDHACWIKADIFEPSKWVSQIKEKSNLFIFSIHFHELIAKGPHVLTKLLRELKEMQIHGHIAVLEQPRLFPNDRETVSASGWLYSQSNVLIHHFIGNGRILTLDQWKKLFEDGGCPLIFQAPTGFLGYELLCFKL